METKAYADWNVDHSFLDNARWHCIIPAFNEASADLPLVVIQKSRVADHFASIIGSMHRI